MKASLRNFRSGFEVLMEINDGIISVPEIVDS